MSFIHSDGDDSAPTRAREERERVSVSVCALKLWSCALFFQWFVLVASPFHVPRPLCVVFCELLPYNNTNNKSAWTICTAVPLVAAAADTSDDDDDDVNNVVGPFSEYRVEVGIQAEGIRFRVKFDYSVIVVADDDDISSSSPPPPLHLKTMTVCREAANQWPRSSVLEDSLFGAPGAAGGLYDPPPIGEEKAAQYCLVDLEGGATVLFPIIMDQAVVADAEGGDSGSGSSSGWVTSLDWTAGPMRYQVDRKVHGGANLRGLRTLELSEVQGANADQYRPRDGGQNMRQ